MTVTIIVPWIHKRKALGNVNRKIYISITATKLRLKGIKYKQTDTHETIISS